MNLSPSKCFSMLQYHSIHWFPSMKTKRSWNQAMSSTGWIVNGYDDELNGLDC